MRKDYGELPLITCYPQQINHIFLNLLLNSLQAIDKQGEIAIRTWYSDSHVYASVSDNGAGIPHDKLNRVFDPFFTTKPVGEGTGLGLSMVYYIVKKHDGDISVDSQHGKGTTFTVSLPAFK